jgi:hypothetical protein
LIFDAWALRIFDGFPSKVEFQLAQMLATVTTAVFISLYDLVGVPNSACN